MQTVEIFKTISNDTLDTMVANFTETIGNLEALETSDMDELIRACEVIGKRVRVALEPEGRGLLLFAKIITEQANQRLS
jgi:hypothetical protein